MALASQAHYLEYYIANNSKHTLTTRLRVCAKPSSRFWRLLTSCLLSMPISEKVTTTVSKTSLTLAYSQHLAMDAIFMQAFRHLTCKISACMGLQCSVTKLWTPDSLCDMAHSLNKVQFLGLRMVFRCGRWGSWCCGRVIEVITLSHMLLRSPWGVPEESLRSPQGLLGDQS